MIWQFIKRDAAWPFAPAAALLFGYLRLPAARSGALALVGILPFAMVLGTAIPGLLVNGTRFEGALPIEGRRLWLSRVVSLLAVLWLSVLAGLTVTFFTSGDLVPPLEAGAGFTVVILAVKCVRIRELTGPRWLKLTVFFAGAGAIFAASSIDASRLPGPVITLAGCGLAALALFRYGWTAAPKSFQIAPLEAERHASPIPAPAVSKPIWSRFVWSPVIRSVFGGKAWLQLFLLFTQVAIGSVYTSVVFTLLFVLMVFDRTRWFLTLPLSRRELFAAMASPPAAAIVSGCGWRIFISSRHPLPPNATAASLAAHLEILCLWLLVFGLLDWRRISKIRLWIRAAPLWTFIAFTMIASWFIISRHANPLTFDEPASRLLGMLPEGGWLRIAVLSIPVMATYLLAQKVFTEREIGRPLTRPAQPN